MRFSFAFTESRWWVLERKVVHEVSSNVVESGSVVRDRDALDGGNYDGINAFSYSFGLGADA